MFHQIMERLLLHGNHHKRAIAFAFHRIFVEKYALTSRDMQSFLSIGHIHGSSCANDVLLDRFVVQPPVLIDIPNGKRGTRRKFSSLMISYMENLKINMFNPKVIKKWLIFQVHVCLPDGFFVFKGWCGEPCRVWSQTLTPAALVRSVGEPVFSKDKVVVS